MTHNFQPGDVVAIPFSDGDFRAMWRDEGGWTVAGKADGEGYVDARPLVVIDPEDREAVKRLTFLCSLPVAWTVLRDALREYANPTPPKPEEPTGLGAVVEDASGTRWVRVRDGFTWRWRNDRLGEQAQWQHVNAVRVLSEGVHT